MVQKKCSTDLTELLFQCMAESGPMLSMLEWLYDHLMEAGISLKIGAYKSEQTPEQQEYRSECRPIRFDNDLSDGAEDATGRLCTVFRE